MSRARNRKRKTTAGAKSADPESAGTAVQTMGNLPPVDKMLTAANAGAGTESPTTRSILVSPAKRAVAAKPKRRGENARRVVFNSNVEVKMVEKLPPSAFMIDSSGESSDDSTDQDYVPSAAPGRRRRGSRGGVPPPLAQWLAIQQRAQRLRARPLAGFQVVSSGAPSPA